MTAVRLPGAWIWFSAHFCINHAKLSFCAEMTTQRRILQQKLVLRQYMESNVLHVAVDVRNCTLFGQSPHEAENQGTVGRIMTFKGCL